MSTRAKKMAVFSQIYANVERARSERRAKGMASEPSRTSGQPPVPQVHLPIPRYMLSEQAYIHEFGYSH